MTLDQQTTTDFIPAVLTKPSWKFTVRFLFSMFLWLVMVFSLTFRYSQVSFFILVLVNAVFCADIFIRSAWRDLNEGQIGFALLVSVCVIFGLLDSALHTFFASSFVFPIKESYIYVALFLTCALWIQSARVREQERAQIYIKKIDDFLPKSARKCRADRTCKVFANELAAGDSVLVRPGERIPCDGRITEGNTAIDEQLLSGNTLPVYKQKGDNVYAGTINKTAVIHVEVLRALPSSELMNVVRAVQQSELRRSLWTDDLDAYAAKALFFLILVVAGQSGFIVTRYGFSHAWQYSSFCWQLLALGVPLALLFAQRLPFFFALHAANRAGIRIQNRYALSHLTQADTIFFDKTGTLTYGALNVRSMNPVKDTPQAARELLEAVACAEQRVNGPFAKALMSYAKEKHIVPRPVTTFEVIPGIGVRATCGKDTIFAGRIQWLTEQGLSLPRAACREKEVVVCVSQNDRYLGYFVLEDAIRPGAIETISFLKKEGKEMLLISGDNEGAVSEIAKEVGIEKQNFNVLPKTKAEIIGNLRALGRKVVMVGDGFNDIVALLRADVGVVFLSGNNTYYNWVDILLSRRDLYPLMDLFTMNKRIERTSRFNGVAVCLLNIIWVEYLLWQSSQQTDWRWTLGGCLAILLVILLNSMRLLKIK